MTAEYDAVPEDVELPMQLAFVQNEIHSLKARREQLARFVRALAANAESADLIKQNENELRIVLGRIAAYREQEAELLAALKQAGA